VTLEEKSFREGFARFCPQRASRRRFTAKERARMRYLSERCAYADKYMDRGTDFDPHSFDSEG
jgi:hypothetical protein